MSLQLKLSLAATILCFSTALFSAGHAMEPQKTPSVPSLFSHSDKFYLTSFKNFLSGRAKFVTSPAQAAQLIAAFKNLREALKRPKEADTQENQNALQNAIKQFPHYDVLRTEDIKNIAANILELPDYFDMYIDDEIKEVEKKQKLLESQKPQSCWITDNEAKAPAFFIDFLKYVAQGLSENYHTPDSKEALKSTINNIQTNIKFADYLELLKQATNTHRSVQHSSNFNHTARKQAFEALAEACNILNIINDTTKGQRYQALNIQANDSNFTQFYHSLEGLKKLITE
jgi:hypothetical protein